MAFTTPAKLKTSSGSISIPSVTYTLTGNDLSGNSGVSLQDIYTTYGITIGSNPLDLLDYINANGTPTVAVGTKILELENGNYVAIRQEGNQYYFSFYYANGTQVPYVNISLNDASYLKNTSNYDIAHLYFSISKNESNNKYYYCGALGFAAYHYLRTGRYMVEWSYGSNLKDIDQWFAGQVAPSHVWTPFASLAGNNGQFAMKLSEIDLDIIGDGETQASSADPSDFIISPRSSLYNLSVNMLDGQEYTIAYCGDNYLTCTKRTVAGTQSTSVYLTLKFYFRSDTLIYTTPELQITRIGTTAPNDYYLSLIVDSDNQQAAPDLINEIFVVSQNVYYYNNWSLPSDTQMDALYIWLQDNGNAQSGDPYGTGSTDDGGDPNGPRPMDNLPDSNLPTTGGLNLSIVTLYTPTDTELSAISAFLWSNDVLDNFKKYFNNFADNILCLYSLPFKPSGTLPTKAFKVGNITSDNPTLAAVEYCTVRYFDIDMGSYDLESKWGSYLDYSPYTKIEIYLPYIGLHSLDIDELMSPSKNDGTLPTTQGCKLSLVYRLDIITGIIVAKIKVNGQIRYQFTGKVGATIPLTGQTYSNLVNSIITAGAGLATTIATGGLTAPMSAAATVTATIQAQKPQVTSVGNITGDASMLATDIPYLRISTPNKPLLEDQQVFTGFPSYKVGTLSDFTGYTEVVDAHVEGISCTEEERAKILTYLKDGVII